MLDVSSQKVLVVGAGAIGCEIIRCLVLEGFEQMTIVDMDVIEVTNLHRQVLFDKTQCGRFKSECAAEWAKRALRRRGSSDDGVTFLTHPIEEMPAARLREFALVFSALDNLAAIRVVSRRCVAHGVPLVISNTNSRLATVQYLVVPGHTPCYDCLFEDAHADLERRAEVTCSLRASPKNPKHAAQWAHAMFVELLEAEAREVDSARALFHKLFVAGRIDNSGAYLDPTLQHIKWRDELDQVSEVAGVPTHGDAEWAQWLESGAVAFCERAAWHVTPPDLDTCMRLFSIAASALLRRERIEFEKDDPLCRVFLGSLTNMQCHVFKLDPLSFFDMIAVVATLAPAAVSASAMAAGSAVLLGLQWLQHGELHAICGHSMMTHPAVDQSDDVLVGSAREGAPREHCVGCHPWPELRIDGATTTRRDIVRHVIEAAECLDSETATAHDFDGLFHGTTHDAMIIADMPFTIDDMTDEQWEELVADMIDDGAVIKLGCGEKLYFRVRMS